MRRNKEGRSSLSIPRNRFVKSVVGWPRPAKRLLMFASDLIGVPVALWVAFALKYDSLSVGFEHDPIFYIGCLLYTSPSPRD